MSSSDISPKSRLVAFLLCFFLGFIGVHRFYVGKTGSGVAQIVTCGGLGIWALIDLIMIAVGSFTDANGAPACQLVGARARLSGSSVKQGKSRACRNRRSP